MTCKEELEKDLQDAKRVYEEIHCNLIFTNEEYNSFNNYIDVLKIILSVLVD